MADAGFALAAGAVSDVVKGQFGPALIRVTEITPANLKPYDEVAAQLKQEIAVDRAASDALNIHDKIEDARVSGKSLGESAKAVGLEERAIAAVDANGLDKNGAAVEGLDEKAALLRAVFASDIGVDDPPLATKDRGFVWFEVTKVEPSGDRSLDEVKDQVVKQWQRRPGRQGACRPRPPIWCKSSMAARRWRASPRRKSSRRKARPTSIAAGPPAGSTKPSSRRSSTRRRRARVRRRRRRGASYSRYPPIRRRLSTPPIRRRRLCRPAPMTGLADDLVSQYIAQLQRQLGVVINDNALQAAEGS